MDAQQLFNIKKSILNDYGFYYEKEVNKWINRNKEKVLHGDWVKITDTSKLIQTINEILNGCPNLRKLKNILTELQLEGTPKQTEKFIKLDKVLNKIFGEKWINS